MAENFKEALQDSNNQFQELGKMPPQAVDFEEVVLGAIMLERNAFIRIASKLSSNDFYNDSYKEIFEACRKLFERGKPIDVMTVANELRSGSRLEFIGGPHVIMELTNKVGSSANIESHAEVIKEKSILRYLIKASSEIQQDSYGSEKSAQEIYNGAQQKLLDAPTVHSGESSVKASEVIYEAAQSVERLEQGKVDGVRSYIPALDRITTGFHNSDLIIWAARPSQGKTASAIQVAINVARSGQRSAIFSLEMNRLQMVNRIISNISEIDGEHFRYKGFEERGMWQRFNKYTGGEYEHIYDSIIIDSNPSYTIIELRAAARRLKMQHDIDKIIVDYLQLMNGADKRQSREQAISEISRGLKLIAKELNVPVIALSQLSRAVETRGGAKRPILSDLRESGCLIGSTNIQRPNCISRIKDLDGVSNFGIFAENGKSVSKMKAKKGFKTKISNVLRLKLTTGHEVYATGNHKFLTESGWRQLQDIDISNKVAIPVNYFGKRVDYHPCVAYFMGAMIANGKVHKRQPLTYTCNTQDIELANKLKDYAEEFFDVTGRVLDNRPKYNWINAFFKSNKQTSRAHWNPIVKFFKEQGIYDKRAKNKALPESIFSQRQEIVKGLIAGLFDNDGSVNFVKCESIMSCNISYSSSSKTLIDGLQLLLQMCGIVSRAKELHRGKHTWYNLYISGRENMLTFIREIPLRSQRKNLESDKIKEHYKHAIGGWTRHFFNENKSLAFVDVDSVEEIQGEYEVYDIEVPEHHNFIANGVLAHNSIEQDADQVIFQYRPEYYGITEDEAGNPTHGKCELIVAKNRNGRTGTANTIFHGRFSQLKDPEDFQEDTPF